HFGYGESLLAAFDGARPCNDGKRTVTDFCTAKIDGGSFWPQIERSQLVRFGHTKRLGHAWQIFETTNVHRALIAGHANRRAGGARHRMRAQSERLDHAHHAVDFAFRRPGSHYD